MHTWENHTFVTYATKYFHDAIYLMCIKNPHCGGTIQMPLIPKSNCTRWRSGKAHAIPERKKLGDCQIAIQGPNNRWKVAGPLSISPVPPSRRACCHTAFPCNSGLKVHSKTHTEENSSNWHAWSSDKTLSKLNDEENCVEGKRLPTAETKST